MLVYKTKLIKTNIIILLLAIVSCLWLLKFSYAEEINLKEYLDYSNLSDEDKKEEAELIYKYAKKSYDENDLETAKTLFYKVLELEPDHVGANRYIEYIIPKKLSQDKYEKVKEAKIVLDKKEELEFKNLDKSIEDARKRMEDLEKDRATREALYKSNLNKLEKDKNKKAEMQNEERKKAREKAEKRKQEDIAKQKKIKEAEELQKQKISSVEKVKDIKKEAVKFKDKEIAKEDIKATEGIGERTEEKLVKEMDKKEDNSWKMMEKELNSLQKESKRLKVQKDRQLRKKELKEQKEKKIEKEKQYKTQKIEEAKKKALDRQKEIEAKKREAEEKEMNSPAYKAKQEKKEQAKKKAEELVLKKAMLRQQKLKEKNVSESVKKEEAPQEPQQIKEPLGSVIKESVVVSEDYKNKIEKALMNKDKESQIKTLYKEGVHYYKLKEYDSAKEIFSKIIEINPCHLKALDYLYIYIPEAQDNPR